MDVLEDIEMYDESNTVSSISRRHYNVGIKEMMPLMQSLMQSNR